MPTAVASSFEHAPGKVAQRVHGLSVCIPVYNEADAIAETLTRCLACESLLRQAGVGAFEVIVAYYGSRDATAERVRQFPFPVRLIQHAKNKGYGAALKTGFSAAKYDLVGFLDADATYPPEFFPALCKPVLDDEADLVVGSRMAGADSRMPVTRRIGNTLFAHLLTIIGRTSVSDTASGMRVFRKSALEVLSPLPDGLYLNPVKSTRALSRGIRLVEGHRPA